MYTIDIKLYFSVQVDLYFTHIYLFGNRIDIDITDNFLIVYICEIG